MLVVKELWLADGRNNKKAKKRFTTKRVYQKTTKGGNQRWSFWKKIQLREDVGRGFLAIHGSGIVHWDVEIENILIFRLVEKERMVGKVGDFESSVLDFREDNHRGLPAHTISWSAPEYDKDIPREHFKFTDVYKADLVCSVLEFASLHLPTQRNLEKAVIKLCELTGGDTEDISPVTLLKEFDYEDVSSIFTPSKRLYLVTQCTRIKPVSSYFDYFSITTALEKIGKVGGRWVTGRTKGIADNAVMILEGAGANVDMDLHTGLPRAYFEMCKIFWRIKAESPTSMLGALLKQVVGGLEEVPGEIAQAYGEQKKVIGGRVPQLSDIVKMLQATSSEKRTFICIDALDECVEGHRVKILDSLKQILEKSPATRVFVTGRPHIRPEIERRLTGRVGSVCISPKRDDIIGYLHTRLGEDTNPDAMDSSLEADILKKIPQEVSEIFLLVSLNIDAILQETTIHRRREKLSTMTDGLGLEDAYGAAIGRIKGQGGEKARLGLAALMWIFSYSQRPLKANELCPSLPMGRGFVGLARDLHRAGPGTK
ncbi:hypothetical protein HOY82DRAFT_631732 [Tuber indicum]|nr:hypothetical protein HOY82DRAFT_631732 [Tuber indicum]